ncbi:DsbA family protein [Alphaproteobacteria bacterium]|nr:DsbA family protein [Alphaproteobacteria bacterium]
MHINNFYSFSLKSLTVLGLSAAVIAFAGSTAQAQDATFTPEQKSAIVAIFEEHLKEKPEIVMEAITLHQENEQKAEQERAESAVKENLAAMTGPEWPFAGNVDGDVTVIEFFDFNCGYCKRAVPDIQAALKEDPNVKFIFHEMPILGPTSRTAAQYALAAHKQGKYFEYHVALMEHVGQKTEEEMVKLGEELKLDVDQLKTDAESEEVGKMIEESMELASKIGIRGTPAFIVEDTLFRGYLGPDGMKREIDKARGE